MGFQQDMREFLARNATLGSTQRYREATMAERYYQSTQHEEKRDWWDRSVPLRKRKPRIIVPLYREMIDSLDRFVWGGHRFPAAVVKPTQDASGRNTEVGPLLDSEQAEDLTSFLGDLIHAGRFVRAAKEFTNKALITSSCAVLIGVRGGRLTYHVEPGKHCTPKFEGPDPTVPSELEILYQYPKEVTGPDGRFLRYELCWYRRTITDRRDIIYVEQPVRAGIPPEWTEDAEKSVDHNLGFCPVHWIRVMPQSDDPIDGRPVIDPSLYPMLDAVSYLVSQRQRATEYGVDPQPMRKGIPESERADLEKNPGAMWDLPVDGDIKFAEMAGTGVVRATETIKELVRSLREAVGVVKADPEITSGNISGVVLEFLHAPMIALASDLRLDLGDDGLARVLGLALRIVCVVSDRGEDVWIPGVERAVEILKKAQRKGIWLDPQICFEWPPFFADSAADQLQKVTAATAAIDGKLISKITATRAIGAVFGVRDPSAEQEAIEKEAADAQKNAPPAPSSITTPPNGVNGGSGGAGEIVALEQERPKADKPDGA